MSQLCKRYFIEYKSVKEETGESLRLQSMEDGGIVFTPVVSGQPKLVVFKSGDFIISTGIVPGIRNISGGYYSVDSIPKDRKILRKKIKLASLKRKKIYFKLLKTSDARGLITLSVQKKEVSYSSIMEQAFFTASIKRIKIEPNKNILLRIRALAELHGYNAIYKRGFIVIKRKRKKSTRVKYVEPHWFESSERVVDYAVTNFTKKEYSYQGLSV